MAQETSRPIVASWYRKGRLITVRHYVRRGQHQLPGEALTLWLLVQ